MARALEPVNPDKYATLYDVGLRYSL